MPNNICIVGGHACPNTKKISNLYKNKVSKVGSAFPELIILLLKMNIDRTMLLAFIEVNDVITKRLLLSFINDYSDGAGCVKFIGDIGDIKRHVIA